MNDNTLHKNPLGIYCHRWDAHLLVIPDRDTYEPILATLLDLRLDHEAMRLSEYHDRMRPNAAPVIEVNADGLARCLERLKAMAKPEEVSAATGELRRF